MFNFLLKLKLFSLFLLKPHQFFGSSIIMFNSKFIFGLLDCFKILFLSFLTLFSSFPQFSQRNALDQEISPLLIC